VKPGTPKFEVGVLTTNPTAVIAVELPDMQTNSEFKTRNRWVERADRAPVLSFVLMELPPRKEADFCGIILSEGTEHLCNDVRSFMVGRIASSCMFIGSPLHRSDALYDHFTVF